MSETNGERWARENPALAKISGNTYHAELSQPTRRKRRAGAVPGVLPMPTYAAGVLTMTLPLPDKVLHKNGRTRNAGYRAALVRKHKNAAAFMVYLACSDSPWTGARIDAEFWLDRKHDDDGLWTWLVAYRDGISEALQCNDANFTCGTMVQHVGAEAGGRREVVITVTRSQPENPS